MKKLDAWKNIYPSPSDPGKSIKVEGFDMICYAIWYLQIDKVKFYLEKYQDVIDDGNEQIFKIIRRHNGSRHMGQVKYLKDSMYIFRSNLNIYDTDNYGKNILMTICLNEIGPAKIIYNYVNNIELFDKIFFSILTTLKITNLWKLISYRNYLGNNAFKVACRAGKYHYALALLNYGCKITDNVKFLGIKSRSFRMFIGSKRLACIYPPGQPRGKKLLQLETECPITLEETKTPAIIEDGYIYEFSSIYTHLKNNCKSPMTGDRLICSSIYLINENMFVHL